MKRDWSSPKKNRLYGSQKSPATQGELNRRAVDEIMRRAGDGGTLKNPKAHQFLMYRTGVNECATCGRPWREHRRAEMPR